MNLYENAIEATTSEEAEQAFEALITECMKSGKSREQCEDIVKNNIGYYAGNYNHETRLKVEELYHTEHPIFGKASEKELSPEEIFQMGVEMGKELKKQTSNLIKQANNHCSQGNFEKAETILEALIAIDVDNWILYFNLGSIKCLQEQYEEGLYNFHEARKRGCTELDNLEKNIQRACQKIVN